MDFITKYLSGTLKTLYEPLRASKNRFETSLELTKSSSRGKSIEHLKSEITGLKNEAQF